MYAQMLKQALALAGAVGAVPRVTRGLPPHRSAGWRQKRRRKLARQTGRH